METGGAREARWQQSAGGAAAQYRHRRAAPLRSSADLLGAMFQHTTIFPPSSQSRAANERGATLDLGGWQLTSVLHALLAARLWQQERGAGATDWPGAAWCIQSKTWPADVDSILRALQHESHQGAAAPPLLLSRAVLPPLSQAWPWCASHIQPLQRAWPC